MWGYTQIWNKVHMTTEKMCTHHERCINEFNWRKVNEVLDKAGDRRIGKNVKGGSNMIFFFFFLNQTVQSKAFFSFFPPLSGLQGQQKRRPKRSNWLNLWLTCGTGEIDEVPLSFTLCRERGYRNRTLQCGRPGLRARSRRGVPWLINGTGGPSKTALPADRAQQCSKNNQAAEAAPASSPKCLQLLKKPDFSIAWGEIIKRSAAYLRQETWIWLIRN